MIHDDILAFLRDAQYRVAELTGEINTLLMKGEIESPAALHGLRLELMAFIELLYEVSYGIYNGYNHVLSTDDVPVYNKGFSEEWITHEMQYLRSHTGMSNLPLIQFGPYWTDVVNIITPATSGGGSTGGSINIPGTYGQFLMYDISNQLVAIDLDEWAGMLPTETITDYFAGRS